MQENKRSETSPVGTPPESFPQAEGPRASGIGVLFKSLLWFIVLPLAGMLALKWFVQL